MPLAGDTELTQPQKCVCPVSVLRFVHKDAFVTDSQGIVDDLENKWTLQPYPPDLSPFGRNEGKPVTLRLIAEHPELALTEAMKLEQLLSPFLATVRIEC